MRLLVLLLCICVITITAAPHTNIVDGMKAIQGGLVNFDLQPLKDDLNWYQKIQRGFQSIGTFYSSVRRYTDVSRYEDEMVVDEDAIRRQISAEDDINLLKSVNIDEIHNQVHGRRRDEGEYRPNSDALSEYILRRHKNVPEDIDSAGISFTSNYDLEQIRNEIREYFDDPSAYIALHHCGIFGIETYAMLTREECVNDTNNNTTCTTVTYNGTVCVCPVDWTGEFCMEQRPYRCKLLRHEGIPDKCAPYPDEYDNKIHKTDGIAPCGVHGRDDDVILSYDVQCYYFTEPKQYPSTVNASAFNFVYDVPPSISNLSGPGFGITAFIDELYLRSNVLNMYQVSKPISKKISIFPEHISNTSILTWTLKPKTMSDAYFAGGRIHLEVLVNHFNYGFYTSSFMWNNLVYEETMADVRVFDFEMSRGYDVDIWHDESLGTWTIILIVLCVLVVVVMTIVCTLRVVNKRRALASGPRDKSD